MKLKLEFHSHEEIPGTLDPQFAELPEGSDQTVHFGPIKMMILLNGEPYREVEGELQITEDKRLEMVAGMGASPAVLNVQHGEDPS